MVLVRRAVFGTCAVMCAGLVFLALIREHTVHRNQMAVLESTVTKLRIDKIGLLEEANVLRKRVKEEKDSVLGAASTMLQEARKAKMLAEMERDEAYLITEAAKTQYKQSLDAEIRRDNDNWTDNVSPVPLQGSSSGTLHGSPV